MSAAALLAAMRTVLLTGWIRARPVTDIVRRDRNSAGGKVAVQALRTLWTLLGNAATQDMIRAGYGDLLFLLSSPVWLDTNPYVSQKASRAAFDQRGRREAWAKPFGPQDGQDVGLKGAPGGEARAAVAIWLKAGAPFERVSLETLNGRAWIGLAEAYEAWPQRAAEVVAGIESVVATDGRMPDRAAATAAIQAEYGAELAWLVTPQGQRAVRQGQPAGALADRLIYIRAEVPTWASTEAAAALADAIRARRLGAVYPIKRPGFVPLPPRTGTPPLADLGAARQEAEAPVAEAPVAEAPVDEAPAEAPKKTPKKKKKKRSGLWAGLGLTAAGATLLALLRRR